MSTPNFVALIFILFVLMPNAVNADSKKKIQKKTTYQSQSDTSDINKKLIEAKRLINVDPLQGIKISREAEKLALQNQDHQSLLMAYYFLGENYYAIQYHDSAIIYLKKHLAGQTPEDSAVDFSSHNLLGASYHSLPNRDSAFYFLDIAREIALVRDYNEGHLAAVHNNMAMVYDAYGDMNTAIDYYMKALIMFEKLGETENVATLYNNIGVLNQSSGENEKSIEYFLKSLEIADKNGNISAIIRATTNLGTSYSALERFDEAREAFERAMNLSTQLGYDFEITRAYFSLGNLYLRTKDFENAKAHFLKSYEMSVKLDIPVGMLYNNLNLAETETFLGDFASAGERLKEAEKIINDFGFDLHRDQLLTGYFELEEAMGNYKNALHYYKLARTFEDSIREANNIARLQDILARYESEKKTLENQQLRDKNLIQETTIQNQRLIGGLFVLTFLFLTGLLIIIIIRRKNLSKFNSELTKLNKTLNEQRDRLALSNETKDKLFSIIAHDLRSPFNGLLGFLNLLIEDFDNYDDTEKLEILNSVKKQADTTFGLLENLLQWSMAQGGLFRVKLQLLPLQPIVDVQIEDLASRAGAKNIKIINLLQPEIKAVIDEDMTNTIFRNLINNSIKFTNQGGQITISGNYAEGYTVVKIQDNGIGMNKELSEGLFGDHYPESRVGTQSEKGTGLGLMIVKDFINKQNATIQVQSAQGQGSTFTIRFQKPAD